MANNIVNPNHRIPITALLLCAYMAHAAAGTAQPETQAASEVKSVRTQIPQSSYQVDKTKIARNMAAWDKLMALPEMQPPSIEKLNKEKETDPYLNRPLAKIFIPSH